MQCGCEPVHYQIQQYDQSTLISYIQAVQIMCQSEGKLFDKDLFFRRQLSNVDQGPSLTIKNQADLRVSLNEVSKEITIYNRDSQRPIWMSIDEKVLEVGDIIKLGTTIFKVEDIFLGEKSDPSKKHMRDRQGREDENTCRICFDYEIDQDDPLLNICKCSGSIKFIHLECFRQWLAPQMLRILNRKINMFWLSNIQCELCKTPIPLFIRKQGKRYCVIDYRKNSLLLNRILEDYSFSEDQQNPLSDFNSQFSIGNNENQFIINQNSQRQIQTNEQTINVVLSTQVINEGNRNLQVIVIKLLQKRSFIFGSDERFCDMVLPNQLASQMHASFCLQDQKVVILNLCKYKNTYVRMGPKMCHNFSGKNGVILNHSENKLLLLRNKPWLISCFQPHRRYNIYYRQGDIQS